MVRQVKIQVTLQVEQKSTIPISDKVGPFWYMYYTAFGTTQLFSCYIKTLTTVEIVGEAGKLSVLAGVSDTIEGGISGSPTVQTIVHQVLLYLQLAGGSLQGNHLLRTHYRETNLSNYQDLL